MTINVTVTQSRPVNMKAQEREEIDVDLQPTGPAGPPGQDGQDGQDGQIGPTGPQGSPGVGTGATYTYTQSGNANVWTINHNLGLYPAVVSVQDSAGTEIIGDISYPDANNTVITFTTPEGGKAYLTY